MTSKDSSDDKNQGFDYSEFGMDYDEISDMITKGAEESQKLIASFVESQPDDIKRMVDPLNLTPAFMELTKNMLKDPGQLVHNQLAFYGDYMKLLTNEGLKAAGKTVEPVVSPDRGDRRFKSEAWSSGEPFDFIKQSYLLAADHVMKSLQGVNGLSQEDTRKVEFFTKQYVDALSPSNFVLTNPEVLQATVESKGQNLVSGMQHLMEDIERGGGIPMVKMTDFDAFEVGENLAVTPGKVVYRNRIFELIQYTPTTDTVYSTPLLIFPPWINKYYILDLNSDKSFVRWAIEQGYTVFIVSWVNPDSSLKDANLDDYLKDGYLEALSVVEEITGARSTHTIGYCVAGTMLAATLGYLQATDQADRVKSATFFTAQVDFEDAGDLLVFTDKEQIKFVDSLMEEKGYLDKRAMALSFNMLRSNDLIWSYVVNNYLLGREPMKFDLLYWNCDSTNMPRALHNQYLDLMYVNNALVKPGGVELLGVPIDLSVVETPAYVQAGREDHIAPPGSVFKIRDHFKGALRFVLAGSGHIAGVVNPPSANKYQYWINEGRAKTLDDFIDGAEEHQGSWWPDWHTWLSKRSGKKVPARNPDKGPYPVLADAPGTYVKEES